MKRHVSIPRQQSLIVPEVQNPFYHRIRLGRLDLLKVNMGFIFNRKNVIGLGHNRIGHHIAILCHFQEGIDNQVLNAAKQLFIFVHFKLET